MSYEMIQIASSGFKRYRSNQPGLSSHSPAGDKSTETTPAPLLEALSATTHPSFFRALFTH